MKQEQLPCILERSKPSAFTPFTGRNQKRKARKPMRVVEVPKKINNVPKKRPVVTAETRSGSNENDTVPNEVLADGAASFQPSTSKGQTEGSEVIVTDQLKIFTLLLQVCFT